MGTLQGSGRHRATLIIAAILPWVVWFSGTWALREWYRTGKDPALFTGTCYKSNGVAVSCTFEQWQIWDATPAADIFLFAGGIAAAAVSGAVAIAFLRKK
jgi:hypothetical protein